MAQPTGEDSPLKSIVPVVGIGASAGGVEALKQFFEHAPDDIGVAYVVILHLSPDYESHLASVIQTSTRMPVHQVTGVSWIERNHVYVIAPNRQLTLDRTTITAVETPTRHDRAAPVDLFFRSLAASHRGAAAAVVLSGTGPNGSNGIKLVKEHGGLILVQDPAEAAYDDMPRHSIATGLVDRVLPVAQMGDFLARYRFDTTIDSAATAIADDEQERALREIFALLKARTGHDFANYKPGTVLRRLGRRVEVHGLSGLPEYAGFLREHADETQVLLKDLLISVTSFFRHPDAFRALERLIIPRLFEGRSMQDHVRVWVAGCATGEEAYSIAMLLAEHAGPLYQPPGIQVFATDLDDLAIRQAREGVYSSADVADVSAERVRRFFTRVGDRYTVRRELRELVLFATHNVIRDPPFSHLALVSCRNLLIYLNRSAQQRLLETFHFALGGSGFLMLGTSESIDPSLDLFVSVDKGAGIYQTRPTATRVPTALSAGGTVPVPAIAAHVPARRPQFLLPERAGYAELHLRLLEEVAPPSLVTNEEYEVVHLSPRVGRYLQVGGGEPSRNVLEMVRPEIRMQLRTALLQASVDRVTVTATGLELRVDDHFERLTVTVRPVMRDGDPAHGYFIILFQGTEAGEPQAQPVEVLRRHPERQLEEEVIRVKGQLRGAVVQYETQAEELRASNEELQALNEELRSAVEELETSKEELQSVNEELVTVNQELKNKIDELSQTNNDFQNLINSTDIGTIFLDRFLRVKLFTPRAREIFNLIPVDIGRPLLDIATTMNVPELRADVDRVLQTLQTRDREVQTRAGRWYMMRLLPYRTAEDRIEGVVMIFFEITERRAAEQRLAASEERLRLLIDSAVDDAIFTVTADNIIDSWNSGAERMFGYGEQQILGQPAAMLYTDDDRAAGVPDEEMRRAATDGRAVDARWYVRRDGTRLYCSSVMTLLRQTGCFAKIAHDLTDQQQAEDERRRAQLELEARVAERTAALEAEVAERRHAEQRASALVRQQVTIQEDERRRIARDLHDQLGQAFTALRLKLDAHRATCTAAPDLETIAAQAERIDTSIEYIAWQLRPTVLDDLGLSAALGAYVKEWSSHSGVPAQYHADSLGTVRLEPEFETHLYRIAQEALNNVARHARASTVDVLLGSRNGAVVLVVEDDGVGFDPSTSAATGLGIGGMRERARLCGGALEIESRPDGGTSVFATLPLSSPASS